MAQERKAGPPAKFPTSLIERKQSEAQMPQFVSAVWQKLRREGVNLPRQVVMWGIDVADADPIGSEEMYVVDGRKE